MLRKRRKKTALSRRAKEEKWECEKFHMTDRLGFSRKKGREEKKTLAWFGSLEGIFFFHFSCIIHGVAERWKGGVMYEFAVCWVGVWEPCGCLTWALSRKLSNFRRRSPDSGKPSCKWLLGPMDAICWLRNVEMSMLKYWIFGVLDVRRNVTWWMHVLFVKQSW